jgi:hypothetical protein
MTWNNPDSLHHDAMINAIHEASRHIALAITEGFKTMADAQAQALADLSTAVSEMAAAVTAAVNEIETLGANAGAIQPNDSAAIEAQAAAIKMATSALTAAIPAPVTPPAAPAA